MTKERKLKCVSGNTYYLRDRQYKAFIRVAHKKPDAFGWIFDGTVIHPDGREEEGAWKSNGNWDGEDAVHVFDLTEEVAVAVAEEKVVREKEKVYIMLDIYRCARCGVDHKQMKFVYFTNPPEDYVGYAMCPTNGEPVLLRLVGR